MLLQHTDLVQPEIWFRLFFSRFLGSFLQRKLTVDPVLDDQMTVRLAATTHVALLAWVFTPTHSIAISS